jgi:antitoxin ParD1/3/4
MEKLSITLPTEMVNVIKAEVEAGTFASTSEVLREAMRVWMRREEEHKERIAAIRARVQASLDDPRPSLTGEEIDEWLESLRSDVRAEHRSSLWRGGGTRRNHQPHRRRARLRIIVAPQ